MGNTRKRQSGFSMIELLITVAIAGVLASIAIPGFQRMQLRSKSAEGRSNLAAIRTAEGAFMAEFGSYIAAAPTPAAIPGTGKVEWPSPGGFDALGWSPHGAVSFQYAVTVAPGGALAFTAEAASDLDENGLVNVWGYVHPTAAGVGVIGVFGCPDTGVWNADAAAFNQQDTVGPCAPNAGKSIF